MKNKLEQLKKCNKCKEVKSISEFSWRKDNNGYRNQCKKCCNLLSKKWEENNPRDRREQYREYHKNNIEKEKKYRKDNAERLNEKSKEYYRNNIEKVKERHRLWQKNHPGHMKEWRKNNPIMAREQHKRAKMKRMLNPMFKLNETIASIIRQSLKYKNSKKRNKYWETIVNFTLQELKEHLEKQFKDGMTWINYGKWHVDHIKPISSFNFSSYEDKEFKKCWALDNLQPLWAEENILKGTKIIK